MLYHSTVHLSCSPSFFWEVLTQKSHYSCSKQNQHEIWSTNDRIHYQGHSGDSFNGKIIQIRLHQLINFLRYDESCEGNVVARYCFQLQYAPFGMVVILSVETFQQLPGLRKGFQKQVTAHLNELASLTQGFWLLANSDQRNPSTNPRTIH